ncbi:hypothetical protein LTR36_010757 [Oleoguttula mirabilis]|uniref:Uncharacterized protein n=1 Tax=Oleoguttula mirabilis TaxID=1507867 RepID=A0AAV9JRM1_9PEZI|nr:hypothetical protein LTR36_010757 [Oleoguttula mirabilis]
MAEGRYSGSRRPESYASQSFRPNGPIADESQSTIVQSFATDLDSMFGLSSGAVPASSDQGVGQLEQNVEEKKQTVTEASRDLQALEAKLREMEAKLAQVSRGSSPQRQANAGLAKSNPDKQSRPQNTREDTETLMAGMPGAMPPSPRQYSGSNDYVMVDRNGRSGQSVG